MTPRQLLPGAQTARDAVAKQIDRGRKADVDYQAKIEAIAAARAKAIAKARTFGWTYEALGEEFGLTKQRVQAMAQYKANGSIKDSP